MLRRMWLGRVIGLPIMHLWWSYCRWHLMGMSVLRMFAVRVGIVNWCLWVPAWHFLMLHTNTWLSGYVAQVCLCLLIYYVKSFPSTRPKGWHWSLFPQPSTQTPVYIARLCLVHHITPRPPIDSILTLMTVWRIRGKFIRTAITYVHLELAVLTVLGLAYL